MVYGLIQNKPVKEEPIPQGEVGRGWGSLKWLGEAIIVVTVPGGLVLWLGREVMKRRTILPGSGWFGTGRNWINRKLTWMIPAVQKITP